MKGHEECMWTIWGDKAAPLFTNLSWSDAKEKVDNSSILYAQCDEHGKEYEGE